MVRILHLTWLWQKELTFNRMPKACYECSLSSDLTLCLPTQAAFYNSLPPASLNTLLPLRACAAFVNFSCWPPAAKWVPVQSDHLTGLCSSSHFNYGMGTVPPTFRNDKWYITSVNQDLWIIQNRDNCKLDGMTLYQLLWVVHWRLHELPKEPLDKRAMATIKVRKRSQNLNGF